MHKDLQAPTQHDALRIEFKRCCESLDLLENQDELEKTVAWILMMNRLDAMTGHGRPSIESGAEVLSLTVEISCSESETDEMNARNAVADLLGLFDPAEHRVVRVCEGAANDDEIDIAPLALWPRKEVAHQAARP